MRKSNSATFILLLMVLGMASIFSSCNKEKTLYLRLLNNFPQRRMSSYDHHGYRHSYQYFLAEIINKSKPEEKKWVYIVLNSDNPYEVGDNIKVMGEWTDEEATVHHNRRYRTDVPVFWVREAEPAQAEKDDKGDIK